MCITKVIWNIPETYVKEGKHFTVSYVTTDGKTEKAVALHNVGHYICDAVGDHTCTQDSPGTSAAINSVTSCVTGRLYILAADGEKGFPCTPAQNGRKPDVKIEVSDEDSNAPCSLDTPVVSDEANSRNKRKASEAFRSGEADKVVIGISCGVATLVIVLAAGATFYFIKRRGKKKEDIRGYDAVSTNI
ncbi:hypothetical protein C0Q70_12537 [Pomacea canaliculata]|uniref:Uncharacterized protein n=1 Tax=Pomacea canaliculata TaxID=400727 RepID=A0A2T7P1T5_POMCA|nr:hypothetical protein C0Q70_12537 [Pomacea canaliculata]